MRRVCCLLLCLLLPATALAEPAAPYAADTILRYAALTPTQQSLVDALYDAALAQEDRVTFDGDVSYDDVKAAMTLLTTDFPELFHLDGAFTIGYGRLTPDVANYVTLGYTMDKARADQLRQALLREAQALADAASGDAFQRELFFHDALCRRVSYSDAGDDHHLATAALFSGAAACEGYAQAMSLLCRLAGIPCSMVYGQAKGGNHAWNALLVDGALCYTDVTWDDQPGLTVYWYFNLSDEQLAATHRLEEGLALPWPSSDAREYHRVMGLRAATLEEAKSLFCRQMAELVRHGQPVRIRFAQRQLYADFVASLDALMDAYNEAAAPEDRFFGAFSWLDGEETACLTLYTAE